MKKRWTIILVAMVCILDFHGVSRGGAPGYPEVMFILDGSGSMWGRAGERVKIDAAREVLEKVVPALPPEVNVGLTVYGHNRKGDCADIEILVPPGSDDRSRLLEHVGRVNPKGKTPIADSVRMVAETLKSRENETTIVLVSDGVETCNDAPCDAIRTLKATGVKFILHVVGFGVDDRGKEQLSCFADAGSGRYFGAGNADALLAALKSVREEVARKVEKAKTTRKKATSGLGKLRIRMPESGVRSVNAFKVIRKKDGKTLKTVKSPKADSTHPLLAGEYELIAAFANSNYRDPSDVSFGSWTVLGGDTTTVDLGAMAFNVADAIAKAPVGAVIVTRPGDETFSLMLPYTGNDYYFYKTKPLPPGTYDFSVHYKRSYLYKTSERPVTLARDVRIEAGKESVVTLDAGVVLKKPGDSTVTSWELIPVESETPVLAIERATNGDYPLWSVYAAPPGEYNLNVYMEGMDEPLPVGEALSISRGGLLEFDTGL